MSPLLFALLFFLNNALASPLTVVSPFSVISSHTSNATSSSIKGRPSLPPKCILRLGPSREQYGKIDYDSCDRAIAKIPREPRNHPVLRNFYVKTEDRSMTMPNMEIPVVEIEGESEMKGVPFNAQVSLFLSCDCAELCTEEVSSPIIINLCFRGSLPVPQ